MGRFLTLTCLSFLGYFCIVPTDCLHATSFDKTYQIVWEVFVRSDRTMHIRIKMPENCKEFKHLKFGLYRKMKNGKAYVIPLDTKYVNFVNPSFKPNIALSINGGK